MAAAVLNRFLRKPPSSGLRTITGFNITPLSDLPIPLFSPRNPDCSSNPQSKIPNHLLGFLDTKQIPFSQPPEPPPPQVFPSFSYGYFLNPIFPSGLDQSVVDAVEEGLETIWADSVKKKRKRKMNKHKYKKLRKRLRRKT